jgi:hypothetical protein
VSDTLRRALPLLVMAAIIVGIWLGIAAFDGIS